jgi:hypothetical protein
MGGEEENNQRGGGHDLHENLRMHYTAMQQQPDVLCSPSPSSLLVDLCIAVFFPSSYSLICCRFLSRALSLSLGMDSQAFQEHVLRVFSSLVERVSLSWVSFSCLFPSTGESILFLQRKLGMAPNVKPVRVLPFWAAQFCSVLITVFGPG